MEGKNSEGVKRIFIKTKSGRQYSGYYLSEDELFIYIIDKFDSEVRISLKEIEVMEDES